MYPPTGLDDYDEWLIKLIGLIGFWRKAEDLGQSA